MTDMYPQGANEDEQALFVDLFIRLGVAYQSLEAVDNSGMYWFSRWQNVCKQQATVYGVGYLLGLLTPTTVDMIYGKHR